MKHVNRANAVTRKCVTSRLPLPNHLDSGSRSRSALAVVVLLFLSGCSCSSDEPVVPDSNAVAPAPKSGNQSVSKPPATADKAVLAIVHGITNNEPRAVWDAMPSRYQEDMNEIVHLFAQRMDRTVWTQTFGAMRKYVYVLESKKEFVLASSITVDDLNPEIAAANYDALVTLFRTIVSSDLSNLDQLEELDVGEFLTESGADIFEQLSTLATAFGGGGPNPFKTFSQTKASVVRVVDDVALVELKPARGAPIQVEFVRVEGKWVPKPMADAWDSQVRAIKEQLQTDPVASNEERKKEALVLLTIIDSALDQLSATESEDDFNEAYEKASQLVGKLMLANTPATSPPINATIQEKPEPNKKDLPPEFEIIEDDVKPKK